ncbi:phosphoglycerate kinase [Marinithermus hydrothermalis]|uniref:Phosphoglycerate kinase n=1 Tax=Marinithermus hydrothermalis (strain DSM 14884 / JCM 11576 / T1) TaxID=869210 RepID=F2NQL2_MARHT|nr:phosphoglycerate kinase [Marinithermus hydrothermalis]AEB11950.1 Phosphoglycerate kinase [Marinithermus hydrothermalis DSM 14884]
MRTVRELNAKDKRVLVRVDYNVPIKDGVVQDDTRIQASLPTLRHLLEQGAALILMSHLGRPKGVDDAYRMAPVAARLEALLQRPVRYVPSLPGADETHQALKDLRPGEVALLENVRFEPGETKNDPELARRYARLGDAFVLDAFGSAHRAHASVTGVARELPGYAGLLVEREVKALGKLLEDAPKPYWVVLGGAKISDKIGVIENLLPRVDGMIIGGAMAFTFIKAQGGRVGDSLVEEDKLELARELMRRAEAQGVQLLLPTDSVAATRIEAGAPSRVMPANAIEDGWMGLDIGPDTRQRFAQALQGAATVFWNGPMGVFEVPGFEQGTLAVAQAIAGLESAYTVVGGGDSVAAANRLGLAARFSHVSTGGGASLEFLERGTLPGLEVLQ